MHDEEKTLCEIEQIMGRHYSTISKALKRTREPRVHVKNAKTGRKRISDVRDDKNLI
ncbi:hypothetical protein A3Q56_08786 [Intoshia linei]|uniref:Transposase IS30-like HTH domain-containing protein n=1 Tax=Intoshia linei TaxID=1819745 RepID=A0A177AN86_9BILA|nr:hypothetical protein A3Q56_08786 [Intoshia linei]